MNRREVFDTLCIDEGVVDEIYSDHLGYPTFGVGHLITQDDDENGLPLGTKIHEDRIWEAFEHDLDLAIEMSSTFSWRILRRFSRRSATDSC